MILFDKINLYYFLIYPIILNQKNRIIMGKMSYRTLEEEIKVLEQGLPPQEGDGFIGGKIGS